MAWIKMRTDLRDDTEVIGIAKRLKIDADTVVGKLHRFWSWADAHTCDGNATEVDGNWVDDYLSAPGFADAMVAVGWLEISDTGISIPHFDYHNGETAKQRALTARRAARHRHKSNGVGVTPPLREALPKEEKSIKRENANASNGRSVTKALPASDEFDKFDEDSMRPVYIPPKIVTAG